MVKLPEWLSFGGAIGEIAELEDWVTPIAEAAQQWMQIGAALVRLHGDIPLDSPAKVLAYVLDHVDDQEIKDLFAELGLEDTLQKISVLKSEIEASQYAKLLKPVADPALAEDYASQAAGDTSHEIDEGTNEGLIDLTVAKQAAGTGTSRKVGYEFSAAAGAALEVEAGAVWPFRGDNVPAGLLRVGARGSLAAKGGISAPFSWGSIGVHGGGSVAASFGYFYRPSPDALFVSALLPALRGLPDPFDLQSISNAVALAGLEGIVLGIAGEAQAGLELALGKDLEVPRFVTGRAQLAAALAFARKSHWLLSLRARDGGFDIVLSRAKSSTTSWSVGLDLALDLSGLAVEVNAALKQVTNLTGPLLSQIEPFLSPGTYARDQLTVLLGKAVTALTTDSALAEAIRSDASILLSGEASGGLALEDWLAGEITAAIDDVPEGIAAKAQAFVDKIFSRLDARVPAFAASTIGDPAKAEVQALIDQLLADFTALETTILTNPNNTAAVTRELQAIGIKVRGASNKADAAGKGIRELIAQYKAFVDKLIAVIEDAETVKLAAKLAFSGEQTEREQYELLARVTKVRNPATGQGEYSEGARALWRSLMLGKLQPFQRILHDPTLAPPGVALDPSSFLSQFASSTRGFAASLAIVDMQFEFEAVAKGEAEVRQYEGRIVVSAKANATRRMEFLDVSREANFVSVYSLVASKRGEIASRGLTLSVDLARRDENLSQKELKGFLQGLADNRLISASRISNAQTVLDTAGRGLPDKLRGDVTVNFALTEEGLDNLLELGRAVRTDPAADRALFGLAVTALREAGFKRADLVSGALAVLGEISGSADPVDALYAKRHRPMGRIGHDTVQRHLNELYGVLESIRELAAGLSTMFRSIAEIYDQIPAVDPADAASYRQLRDFYRGAELRLAESAKEWIRLKVPFKTRMHPVMLALLRIMISLHEKDGAGGVDSPALGDIARMARPLVPGFGDRYIRITMQLGGAEKHVV